MAEFVEVMKKHNEICEFYSCMNCPLSKNNNASGQTCLNFMRNFPEEFEQAVMSWKKPTEHMKEQKEGEQE